MKPAPLINVFEYPPLALYIHIPWCVRKCPYCDFNSHALTGALPEMLYIEALLSDLRNELEYIHNRPINSIFIGGGTPSLFSAQSLEKLIHGVSQHIPFANDIEITLEANPGTAEQQKFTHYRQLGINRLSIGVQSFHNKQLHLLGRIHSPQEAIQAIEMAHTAGFSKINIDLMHGLPEQTQKEALLDLKQALELHPNHISWYQLTVEPNTQYWSKPPELPDEETLWSIQQQGQQLLMQYGFEQYEISAYAKGASARAQHNLNYWTFGDFIGIGAGAHGKLTLNSDNIFRNWKTRTPKDYLGSNQKYIAGKRHITIAERPFEFMLNALRLTQGVPYPLFNQRTYLPLTHIQTACQKAIQAGLLENNPNQLIATQQGSLFLNNLLEYFMS